jgi:hypothetical protein
VIRRQAILLALAACLAWPAHATIIVIPIHPNDGNLVPNPHFDTYVGGLAGWTESPTYPLDSAEMHPSCDFDDQEGSNGVLLVKEESGLGDLQTCVPIRGGAEYEAAIWALLPLESPAGVAGFHLEWMADRACTTLLQDQPTSGTNAANPNAYQWHRYTETFVAPAGARGMRVGLRIWKLDADPTSFKACLDEPFVIPEPHAVELAAVAALAGARRRRSR